MPPEERAESNMREAFLWGQVAGPILGGCLVWGRSGPSMVFSRAVLSACLASLLVPAAWRGPSHVALRLLQGLCTVSLFKIATKYRNIINLSISAYTTNKKFVTTHFLLDA